MNCRKAILLTLIILFPSPRHQATTDDRARLAPDLAQHLRRTYDRLAVQHGWPALADAAALPDEITASAEWFF